MQETCPLSDADQEWIEANLTPGPADHFEYTLDNAVEEGIVLPGTAAFLLFLDKNVDSFAQNTHVVTTDCTPEEATRVLDTFLQFRKRISQTTYARFRKTKQLPPSIHKLLDQANFYGVRHMMPAIMTEGAEVLTRLHKKNPDIINLNDRQVFSLLEKHTPIRQQTEIIASYLRKSDEDLQRPEFSLVAYLHEKKVQRRRVVLQNSATSYVSSGYITNITIPTNSTSFTYVDSTNITSSIQYININSTDVSTPAQRARDEAAFFALGEAVPDTLVFREKPRSRKEIKNGRRVLLRSLNQLRSICGDQIYEKFLKNEDVVIRGRDFDFSYHRKQTMLFAEGWASHTISILNKAGDRLSNICVYADETPAAEQLVALYLYVMSGNEDQIILNGNLNWVTKQGEEDEALSVYRDLKRATPLERSPLYQTLQQKVMGAIASRLRPSPGLNMNRLLEFWLTDPQRSNNNVVAHYPVL